MRALTRRTGTFTISKVPSGGAASEPARSERSCDRGPRPVAANGTREWISASPLPLCRPMHSLPSRRRSESSFRFRLALLIPWSPIPGSKDVHSAELHGGGG